MKLSRIILAVLFWLSASAVRAQTESDTAPAYRYLFVIDTSSGMKRNDEFLPTIVHDMMFDGIGGKMQAGDVYGVWTFNEEVDTAFLPPMVWLPSLAKRQAQSIDLQIRDIRFKGKSDPATVIKALAPVISRSKDLTVVLLTDGSGVMFGTPYDLQITSIYRQYYHDMSRSRRPFITSLLTRDGKWMAWSVNAAGNNPGVPVLPPRPQPVEEVKAKPITPKPEKKAPPAPPKKPVESIIVKGPLHPQPKSTVEAPKKTAVSQVVTPAISKPEMKPVEAVKVQPQASPTPAKVPTKIVNTAPSATSKPPPPVTKTETAPLKVQETPVPATPVAPKADITSLPSTKADKQPAKPAINPATTVEEYKPPVHIGPKPVIVPAVAKTTTVESKNKPAASPVSPKKVEPVNEAAKPEEMPASSQALEPAAQLAQTAVVTPPSAGTNWGRILLGTILLLAAVLMLWLYTRKSAAVPSGSVISRSLDKQKRS